jgi:hypothetical protein
MRAARGDCIFERLDLVFDRVAVQRVANLDLESAVPEGLE